jgi:prolyl oligopeptidase
LIDVLHGAAADKSELYFQDLASKDEVKSLISGLAARFEFDLAGHTAYVRTNWNAPNNKIIAVNLEDPAREKWREIVPESDAAIESFTLAGGKIVVNYLRNAAAEVKIFNADGKQERKLELPAIGSVNAMSGRWENNYLFFRFDTFHIPAVIYRYDMAKDSREEWARERRPVDSNKFEVKQVWYSSKDGTKVPMFLLYAKGLKLNGNNPVYLTGYGGFNLSLTPAFSTQAVYWAERGGVWAIPNLRGGGEFGEKWHQAGMLEHKQNVFDDFIAAAEWLISNKYTNKDKLAIAGGSNGGLLVGAALTQRPDLFRAVLCSFPLLDMLRYQNFLVARYWTPEYGSAEDAAQFKYLYAYSPYHHVKAGTKYPAVMLWSGDADTRVAPLHARKMTAMLQADNGGPNPILLHYDVKGGHSDARPVSKVVDDVVDQLSFLFWQLGVTAGPQ